MLNYRIFNKKAQVSDTITWVVATIIIIFLIITSIYFSSILGNSKDINKEDIKFYSDKQDWIDVKTNLAYKINFENKEKIQLWINENDGGKDE
jgi:hypothetical protein